MNNARRTSLRVVHKSARWAAGLAAVFLLVMLAFAAVPSLAFAFSAQAGG